MRSGKRWAVLAALSFCLGSTLQSSDRPILVYKKKYIMGTVFEIAAYGRLFEHASSAIDKAFQEIVRMDDLMSNYKPESALSHLNQSAHFHGGDSGICLCCRAGTRSHIAPAKLRNSGLTRSKSLSAFLFKMGK